MKKRKNRKLHLFLHALGKCTIFKLRSKFWNFADYKKIRTCWYIFEMKFNLLRFGESFTPAGVQKMAAWEDG